MLVGIRTDGRWLREFFLEFNLRPFQQPIQGHGDPSSLGRVQAALVSILFYFFHVPGVLLGFFPWAIFLGAALGDAVRQSAAAIERAKKRISHRLRTEDSRKAQGKGDVFSSHSLA